VACWYIPSLKSDCTQSGQVVRHTHEKKTGVKQKEQIWRSYWTKDRSATIRALRKPAQAVAESLSWEAFLDIHFASANSCVLIFFHWWVETHIPGFPAHHLLSFLFHSRKLRGPSSMVFLTTTSLINSDSAECKVVLSQWVLTAHKPEFDGNLPSLVLDRWSTIWNNGNSLQIKH